MHRLVLLGIGGFLAQLINGSLGMGYGVSATTMLLLAGLTPAAASASVHLSEIGVSLAIGTAHWRFGNVDWRVVALIAVPGALGAFAGAIALSSLATRTATPWTSGILALLGIYLLIRFSRPLRTFRPRPVHGRFLAPLGLTAGFIDATGGGGWGPVATPALLASGRLEPRKVVGSVDAAQFLVAIGATAGFLIGLAHTGFVWPYVAVLLAGGAAAAPFAAWLVRKVPAQLLGAAVGGAIVLLNSRTFMRALDIDADLRVPVYLLGAAAWALALGLSIRAWRRARNADPAPMATAAAAELS